MLPPHGVWVIEVTLNATSDTSHDSDLSEDTGNGQQGDLLPSDLSWPPFRDF